MRPSEERISELTVKGLPIIADDDNRTLMGYVSRTELRYVIGTQRSLDMTTAAKTCAWCRASTTNTRPTTSDTLLFHSRCISTRRCSSICRRYGRGSHGKYFICDLHPWDVETLAVGRSGTFDRLFATPSRNCHAALQTHGVCLPSVPHTNLTDLTTNYTGLVSFL